jgi:Mg/Co/Ni transporter MgtE
MKRPLRVRDIMSRPVTVVRDTDKLGLAELAMALNECHHVPVVDRDGHLVGLLSNRELPKPGDVESHLVADLMLPSSVTVRRRTPASQAVAMLMEYGLDSVPVVDREQTPVGIVTTADVLVIAERALAGKRVRPRARLPEKPQAHAIEKG